MKEQEQSNTNLRAAISRNSLEGKAPDDADLLDRVLDKGVRVDPIDQIAMISGSVDELHPFVDQSTDGSTLTSGQPEVQQNPTDSSHP